MNTTEVAPARRSPDPAWAKVLIEKFPVLDLAWPAETQRKWHECFAILKALADDVVQHSGVNDATEWRRAAYPHDTPDDLRRNLEALRREVCDLRAIVRELNAAPSGNSVK